ncbi:aminotransferase class I/II-fold pyridoxal phosphate-dependent enzyme [Psychrosphaera sp.]|nr:aminotransferase class I/II-fold pyridoxal phosphate-dependent enzyme [Psychrosphaera sp.]
MNSFESFIFDELAQREKNNLLRFSNKFDSVSASQLVVAGKSYINFSSNDYLGLASDFALTEFNKWLGVDQQKTNPTVSSGAMASPLVTGNSEHHNQLIAELLKAINAPSTFSGLLYGSGFSANQGVLNALFKDKSSEQFIYQDKLNHASLLDAGTKLQAAGQVRQKRFKHNCHHDLGELVKSGPNIKHLVVTESVFSMDGDRAPIKRLSAIAKKAGALFMVDDAHGFGLSALSESNAVIDLNDVDIYVVTFGKALGAQGAAVFADRAIIKYLTNFSKEYIYSTHLSPIQSEVVRFNLSKLVEQKKGQDLDKTSQEAALDKNNSRTVTLANNISYFKELAKANYLPLLSSDTPIQPVLIGDEEATIEVAKVLKDAGFWVSAIRYPTVKKGQSRLRVTITSKHKANEISELVDILASALKTQSTKVIR